MSHDVVADLIVLVVVSAAAFSTGWVLRDAKARGLPRRKAITWAALQWVEFPLFLWLSPRIRPTPRPGPRPPAPCPPAPRPPRVVAAALTASARIRSSARTVGHWKR